MSCSNCLLPVPDDASGVRVRMVQDMNLRPLKAKCEHTVSRVYGEFLTHSGTGKAIKWKPDEGDRFKTLDELAAFKPFRIWRQEIKGEIIEED